LSKIVSEGVHQESAGEAHLLSLLWERGLVPLAAEDWRKIRPHPEIMKLRFVDNRSPIDDVPPDLRPDLYRILLDHCHRAVQRRDRSWQPYDPFEDSPRVSSSVKRRKAPKASHAGRDRSPNMETRCTS
jgi:hypothetical protein